MSNSFIAYRVEQQILTKKTERLKDYDILKRRYNQLGVSFKQTKLMKAFHYRLVRYYPPLKKVELFQNICLFSQLLMLREYEVLFWVALNQKKDIDQIVDEYKTEKGNEEELAVQAVVQAIRSRLMMTAFYTKQKMSTERTETAVHTFFCHYFDFFIGKHTDWLLLNEPEISAITPASLNVI